MNTLRIHNLSKTYPNGVRALNDINLEITNGMFGLLGANGKPEDMRKYLGYLPQEFGVYPKISAEKLLNHLAVLKGILDAKQRNEHVTALLQQVNLYQHRKKSVYTFSGGMRQRFGIAQALLGNPKLIIVDEPTAGLDPEESNRFLNLLSEIGENVIVILSTHIVEDVRNLCPKMAILSNGEIITEGNPKDLIASIEGKIWTKTVPKKDIEGYRKTFDVISTKLVAGETQLSVISDHKPEDGFEAITPNLEDFYFAILFKNSTKKQ